MKVDLVCLRDIVEVKINKTGVIQLNMIMLGSVKNITNLKAYLHNQYTINSLISNVHVIHKR